MQTIITRLLAQSSGWRRRLFTVARRDTAQKSTYGHWDVLSWKCSQENALGLQMRLLGQCSKCHKSTKLS